MRSLRADNLKLTNDVTRLTEKQAEAQRKVDIAESSEAGMKTQLKSAEATVRGLKDDLARTKALVAQVRSSCATDVRRRDRQIDTLKKQLGEAGRARGSRGNPAITTISVTADYGAEKGTPSRGADTSAEEYSLRSETNAFLAKLAQDLSLENEAMLGGMRTVMDRLRQMSGFTSETNGSAQVVRQPTWEDMSSELDSVLEHMKTILTNPSFVPIEEVVVREEEINRLKDGWVKMESRWKEAVHLIDGWRKRMAASGKPVCDEELQMGLRLSPVRIRNIAETDSAHGLELSAVYEEEDEEVAYVEYPPMAEDSSFELVPAGAYNEREEQMQGEAEDDDEQDYQEYEEDEPNVEILGQSEAVSQLQPERDSSPLPEAPHLTPLRNSPSAGNRGPSRHVSPVKKPREFTTIQKENTRDLKRDKAPPPPRHLSPTRITLPRPDRSPGKLRSPPRTSLEEALLPQSESEPEEVDMDNEDEEPDDHDSEEDELAAAPPQKTPRRGMSKLPLPRNADSTAHQQSPLTMATIAAKLAASEREADAARVRAKLKAFRGVKRPTLAKPEPAQAAGGRGSDAENIEPVERGLAEPQEQQIKPEKRKRDRRTSKVASRRRSTLSPWELDSLISGNVQ